MLRVIVLRNTVAQILTRLISAAGTFLVALVVARQLGAAGFGQLTKIFLAVGVFYLVLDAGLNAIFVQSASEDRNILKRQFSSFLLVRVIWSLLLIGVVYALFVLSPIPPFPLGAIERHGIAIASLTLVAQSVLISCNALFQLKLQYHKSTIAQIAASLVMLVLLGFVLMQIPAYSQSILVWVVGVLTVSSFVAAVVSLWFARFYILFTIQQGFIKKLLAKSWLFGATLIVIAVNDQMGRFWLSRCCTTAQVGVYGLAYKVFEFPLALPTFFVNSIFPILVIEKRQGRKITSRITKAVAFLILTSIGTSTALYGAAPLLSLIKSDFSASVVPFRLLVTSLPLFFLTALTMWLLILYEKRKVLFAIYATALLCNTLVGMVVIPLYGPLAAAAMVVGSEGLVFILTLSALLLYVQKKDR